MKYSDITIKFAYRAWFGYWLKQPIEKITWQEALTNWINENAARYGARTQADKDELYKRLSPDKSYPQNQQSPHSQKL